MGAFTQKKKQKEEMKVGQIDDLPFVYLHIDENIRNEAKCNNSGSKSQRERAQSCNLDWKLVEEAVAKNQMEKDSCCKGKLQYG